MTEKDEKRSQKVEVWEPAVVTQAIRNHYDGLGPIKRASLIREGFNHNYKIEMQNGTKYVFRVYLSGKYYVRDQVHGDDLQFELDLLTFLRSKGLSVAEPIATKHGSTLGSTTYADTDKRFFALFHYAKGQALENRWKRLTQQQYFALGKLMAQVHVAADEFETQRHRYHLNDETYLLDETLNVLDSLFQQHGMEDTTFFRPFAEDLRAKILAQLPKSTPTYGIIHADLHLGNIFYDDETNQFTLIDFDHCAYGWRAYDMAPCAHLGRTTCDWILEGYNAVRPLEAAEIESFATFNKLRNVWDMGDVALYQPLWGQPVDKQFLENASRQLHCMMGDSSFYCGPPLWLLATDVAGNLAVLTLVVWCFHEMIKNRACFRWLWLQGAAVFKKNHKS